MELIFKKEVERRFNEVKDVATALAAAQGTTPEQAQDPLCQKYVRMMCFDQMSDTDIMVIDDSGMPFQFLPKFHEDKASRERGILVVPSLELKDIYIIESGLMVAEYNDGIKEQYEYHKPADAYFFHSHVLPTIPFPLVSQN